MEGVANFETLNLFQEFFKIWLAFAPSVVLFKWIHVQPFNLKIKKKAHTMENISNKLWSGAAAVGLTAVNSAFIFGFGSPTPAHYQSSCWDAYVEYVLNWCEEDYQYGLEEMQYRKRDRYSFCESMYSFDPLDPDITQEEKENAAAAEAACKEDADYLYELDDEFARFVRDGLCLDMWYLWYGDQQLFDEWKATTNPDCDC